MQDMYSDIGHLANIYQGIGGSGSGSTTSTPSATPSVNNGGIMANWSPSQQASAAQPYYAPTASYSSPMPTSTSSSGQSSVADWYKTWLGREGDANGMNFWQSALNKGMDYNTVYGMFQQQANAERQKTLSGVTLPTAGHEMFNNAMGKPITSLPENFAKMSKGQQDAYNNLLRVSNQTWNDYVPGVGMGVQPGSNPTLQDFLNADPEYQGLTQMYSEGSYDLASYQRELNRISAKYGSGSPQDMANLAREQALKLATDNVDYWNANPNGNDDWGDMLMEKVFVPVVGAFMTGGLLDGMAGGGLFGDTFGPGTIGDLGPSTSGLDFGLGSLGSGSLPVDVGGSLTDMSWLGDGGIGVGGVGGTVGGGIAESIPQVIINGSTGGGLGGLGDILAGAGGLGVLDNIFKPIPTDGSLSDVPDNINAGDGHENIPEVVVNGNTGSGTPTDGSFIPPFVPLPLPGGIGDVFDPNHGTDGNNDNGGSDTGGTGTGLPGGIGDWLGGLGDILAGNVDRIHNTQDQAYWQNYMDKLTGMYAPGSPEAELMRHKLEAMDAASGRNSQYGIREQNLAAMLAAQRAQIMTSPTFYNMGAASRGHYDNSLNSLFSALGGGSGIGSLLGGLGGLFGGSGGLGGLFGGLGSIFGGGTSIPGAVDNVLF